MMVTERPAINALISAPHDAFWGGVVSTADTQLQGLKPVYWIGTKDSWQSEFSGYLQDPWSAFSLDESSCLQLKDVVGSIGIEDLSRLEYFTYIKLLDRVDGCDSFTFSERDFLLKKHLKYWSSVIMCLNIDIVIFSNTPHLPYDFPLYLVAKKLGRMTLMFNITNIPGWCYISEEIGGRPIFESKKASAEQLAEICKEAVEPYVFEKHETPWYMVAQARDNKDIRKKISEWPFLSDLYFTLVVLKRAWKDGSYNNLTFNAKWSSLKCYKGLYETKHLSAFSVARIKSRGRRKKARIKKEYQRNTRVFDSKLTKYVYFPLHYQPELTTSPLGGDAVDQFYVIREAAASLPAGYALVVKEHPSQFGKSLWGEQGRSIGFWEDAARIENVVLVDYKMPSIGIIKDAEAVLTVTGSAGWEAFVNHVPAVVLGAPWYLGLGNIKGAAVCELKEVLPRVLLEKRKEDENDGISFEALWDGFFGKAIKNDIHGVYEGRVTRCSRVAGKYLAAAIEVASEK